MTIGWWLAVAGWAADPAPSAADAPPPAARAEAPAPAVGGGAILFALEGEATCQCLGRKPAPAAAFEKLRPGDVLVLGAGGRAELVFFATGRRERWVGPARITIGAHEGTAKGVEPEVIDLGVQVGAALEALPGMVKRAAGGSNAATVVRGERRAEARPTPAEIAALDAARVVYDALRVRLPPEDFLPELYLAAVEASYARFPESAVLLERAMSRCTARCEPVGELLLWTRSAGGSSSRPE